MEMKRFNYLLEIDILRNSSQIFLGDLRVAFKGFGCPKRHPDALLAKTMITTITIYTSIYLLQKCIIPLIKGFFQWLFDQNTWVSKSGIFKGFGFTNDARHPAG